MERPSFKAYYRVEILSEDVVRLTSEWSSVVLGDPAQRQVAPLLDGRRRSEEIAALLADRHSPAEVHRALDDLESEGLLAEGDLATLPNEAAMWHALGIDPGIAGSRISGSTVTVESVGGVPTTGLERLLAGLAIRTGESSDAAVVVTDDYLRDELWEHNETALATGRPWLLAKPVGTVVWAGPVFWPGVTACWECLAGRLRGGTGADGRHPGTRGLPPLPPAGASIAHLPTTLQIGLSLAATELVWGMARGHAGDDVSILTYDLRMAKSARHPIGAIAGCPACGSVRRTSRGAQAS